MNTPQPKILTGAWVGACLMAGLIAIFFLASQLVGTPFVPFDFFDWLSRNLPGGLVTNGIDSIVAVIESFRLGAIDVVAKSIQQLIALSIFVSLGMVAGAVAYNIRNELKPQADRSTVQWIGGVIYGAIIGLPIAAISAQMNRTATTPDTVNTLWVVLAFIGWGVAHMAVYERLAAMPANDAPTTGQVNPRMMSRRDFLSRFSGATLGFAVFGGGLGALLMRPSGGTAASAPTVSPTATAVSGTAASSTAEATREVVAAVGELIPAPGTRPEITPLDQHYRIDINLTPPTINEGDWNLIVDGLVDTPVQYTLDDLRTGFEPVDQYVTMSCISNPIAGDLISTIRWTGIPMQDFLNAVKPTPEARFIHIYAEDGFDEYVDMALIEADERIMLCYAWDGEPLQVKHGFPLRIFIPDRYGMKQPKWITRMEFVAEWDQGYWVRRGWSREAIVRATSVIDTANPERGETGIALGGIAWAGARGISKVEVQIDGGDWQEAQLREAASPTTWNLWRYDWANPEGGRHAVIVRCVEADGTPQIDQVADVRPDGATGYHALEITV
jgi:DMSO/TMAO reductase YedYZ molybdopterin-dependent catalytic subunit